MASYHEWLGTGIMAKELVPIILTCVTWSLMLHHRHIEFQYDNEGFVAAISKGSSKDTVVIHLLRALWFSSHTWTSPLQLHTYPHLHGSYPSTAGPSVKRHSNNACLDPLSKRTASYYLQNYGTYTLPIIKPG